jgi:outer membrane lipoprotein-sorting protein
MSVGKRSLRVLSLTLLAGVLGTLSAENLPDPGDPSMPQMKRVTALIERMRIEQTSFVGMRASFEQRSQTELLLEPEVAKGVFYYQAPDKVRWEYFEPTPKVVLVNGDEMTTWYEDLGRAETIKVGRQSDRILKYLGASGSLETLMEYFALRVQWPETQGEGQPYRLKLTPLYERVAKHVELIEVEVDPKRFIPSRLYYLEPGGDETEYIFTDIEVDPTMPPERFRLDLPADVVVRTRHLK